MYGLKQASRAWYHSLSSFLLSIGFLNSRCDTSPFYKKTGSSIILLLIYVDDIIVTGNNAHHISLLLNSLGAEFSIKDLGSLHFFLGIEIIPHATGLLLSQRKYIYDLLDRTKMDGAKPVSTPMASNCHLSRFSGSVFSDPYLYRSTVGALHYLTITRPDLAYAVSKVSQFMQSPTDEHWAAVKRILRYLKHTIVYGLFLQPTRRDYNCMVTLMLIGLVAQMIASLLVAMAFF